MFGTNPFNEYRATQQPVQERTSAECNGMVCKNCGDTFGNPTEGSCMYDSKNPNGKNWMEAKATNEGVNEISTGVVGRYVKKAVPSAAGAGDRIGRSGGLADPEQRKKSTDKGINTFVKRNKGVGMAVDKITGKAKVPATEGTQYVIPEEIPATERTAFHGAAAAAAKAGKSHFNFAGKKHPVTMKKDTARAIADQKEGYYKDMEIKRQDKEMGAKPVPTKKKKEAKAGKKEGDIEMNPKMDTGKSEQKESRIRTALKSVLVEKENHSPNQDKAEKMKDNRKGKGAEDMMAPADTAIANPAIDEPDRIKKDAAKMTANVKTAAKRKGDNPQGDTKIKPGGTPMKDPAAMKAESAYDNMSAIKAAYASMYEEDAVEESYTHEVDYAEDGKHTAKKFMAHAKKAGIKAKIHDPSGPGGGHPVVHLGHKDDDHMHKFLKKHYDPDMEKGDLKHHKI